MSGKIQVMVEKDEQAYVLTTKERKNFLEKFDQILADIIEKTLKKK